MTTMRRLSVTLLSFLVGVVVWAVWLSWGFEDRQYSTTQVLGCGITATVAVASLVWFTTRARMFLVVAGPLALGLTAAWTVWAFGDDDSGLAGVGAIMMLIGTSVGLSTVEAVLRVLVRRLLPHRSGERVA